MDESTWGQRIRRVLLAVAQRRCPQCGDGRPFHSWFRMREACPVCGRSFHRQSGSTTGVMQMGSMVLLVVATVLWFIVDALTGWPIAASLGATVVLSLLFGLWFHPYAKLIWEGIDVLIDSAGDQT